MAAKMPTSESPSRAPECCDQSEQGQSSILREVTITVLTPMHDVLLAKCRNSRQVALVVTTPLNIGGYGLRSNVPPA